MAGDVDAFASKIEEQRRDHRRSEHFTAMQYRSRLMTFETDSKSASIGRCLCTNVSACKYFDIHSGTHDASYRVNIDLEESEVYRDRSSATPMVQARLIISRDRAVQRIRVGRG
jgi:hypothetical protein